MERSFDNSRKLADYIYKDMSPEETVEFEMEISGDPQLSESYELNMQVKNYLQAKIQLEEMRSDPMLENAEKLADMAFDLESPDEKSHKLIPKKPKKNRFRNMAIATVIAASVTIIIAVGILPTNMDPDSLFEHYYEPFGASDFSQRGEGQEKYVDIAQGINYYVDGNYSQSIDQFDQLASDPTIQSEVQFFSALSYMGLGQYPDAQPMLESVLVSDSRYQTETLWYLSLCYLKAGEFEQVNTLLGQLEQYDGLYQKDAQALLKKLRRFKK